MTRAYSLVKWAVFKNPTCHSWFIGIPTMDDSHPLDFRKPQPLRHSNIHKSHAITAVFSPALIIGSSWPLKIPGSFCPFHQSHPPCRVLDHRSVPPVERWDHRSCPPSPSRSAHPAVPAPFRRQKWAAGAARGTWRRRATLQGLQGLQDQGWGSEGPERLEVILPSYPIVLVAENG